MTRRKISLSRKRPWRLTENVECPVLETEPAEPAVGQVHRDILAQPPLRADRIAVADQQHPDHRLRINRRGARMAVVRRKFAAKPTQVENRLDPARRVLRRNHLVETKLVEQTVLPPQRLAHHGSNPVAEHLNDRESCQANDLNRVLQQSWLSMRLR